MANYKQILVAVDFSEHSERAIERAQELAIEDGGALNLIHVVDYFPAMDAAYDGALAFSVDMTDELVSASKNRLKVLAEKYQLKDEQLFVEVGAIRNEVIDKADKHGTDLIVIGSHGWRGIDLLLGSTADSILHHAKCDVLVVRID
ncbi:MAG: universal stress protein [Gammaproteobacteria bacterium]|nr:universal stress protein [Gammaproteobacteria bacterium]